MAIDNPPKWDNIKSKPSTVSGFGITDMASQSVANAVNATNATNATTAAACSGNAATASQANKLANDSGSAPSYSCRAWVNFNGTGTVAIRASGNVSSITDNGVGNYTVNLTTAMPDANFSAIGSINSTTLLRAIQTPTLATGSFGVRVVSETAVLVDEASISASVFR